MAPHKLSLLNSTLPLCARLLCRFASPSSLFVSRRDAEVQSFLDRINKIKPRWVFSHKVQEREEGGDFSRKERRERKGLAVRSFRIGALPQTPKNLCVIPLPRFDRWQGVFGIICSDNIHGCYRQEGGDNENARREEKDNSGSLGDFGGCRAWIWSDYIWHHHDEFLKRMPKSVLLSNWYYRTDFSGKICNRAAMEKKIMAARWPEATAAPSAFIDLEKAGYDQLPCGSIWADEKNFGALVPFCRKRIGRERLKGFLMAPWLATLEANRVKLMKAVDIAAAAFTTAE